VCILDQITKGSECEEGENTAQLPQNKIRESANELVYSLTNFFGIVKSWDEDV
jgi:hypothetical protein